MTDDAGAAIDVDADRSSAKHKHTVGQDPSRVDEILSQNRRLATSFMLEKCEKDAARSWDIFYKNNGDRFFKNKNWTEREFANELPNSGGGGGDDEPRKRNGVGGGGGDGGGGGGGGGGVEDPTTGDALDDPVINEEMTKGQGTTLLEVGCGPGNMLFPVLHRNRSTRAHACDFSARAIEMVKAHPIYDEARLNAFVCDLVKEGPSLADRVAKHPFGPPTVVSLIFVLSAIPPQHHRSVFSSLKACLPVGGTLLFRDFGHGDLAQLRFHQKASAAWCEPSLLSDSQHFYRRGDNTFTYFFNVEELEEHAATLGLEGTVEVKEVHNQNRKTGVQLHRRFIQARWTKIA